MAVGILLQWAVGKWYIGCQCFITTKSYRPYGNFLGYNETLKHTHTAKKNLFTTTLYLEPQERNMQVLIFI